MNFGSAELLVLLVIVGLIAIPVWALVDIAKTGEAEWAATGQQRTLWLALIGFGTLCGGLIGTVLAIVYLVSVRPKLLAARGAGA